MEALRKLERVQSTLAFIDSHGLSSGIDLHSDRFLADLLLFFKKFISYENSESYV